MNNTSPFQNQNPFGAAPASNTPNILAANTLKTTLSALGLGRQTVNSKTETLKFRSAI